MIQCQAQTGIEQIGKEGDRPVSGERGREQHSFCCNKKYVIPQLATIITMTRRVERFEYVVVVEEVQDSYTEISLDEAREMDPECEVGDELGEKIDSGDFGRIAAQTAKQVIIQKVREAERETVFNEYKDRQWEIVTGQVRRFERGDLLIDLGRAEAILSGKEQMPREVYRPGDRIRAIITDIAMTTKGPQIILSRTHPQMLAKLFEAEVPEIGEGLVEIVNVVRDPGSRAKIAVASHDRDIDPVGACVGMRGSFQMLFSEWWEKSTSSLVG